MPNPGDIDSVFGSIASIINSLIAGSSGGAALPGTGTGTGTGTV
ncbi:hypothetical protein ACFWPA_11340 [Rhodococcus sp. NPDC058505]